MPLLHPDVAVALSHAGLRVQERHADAPLRAQPGIVVVTLLQGVSVVLLSQTDRSTEAGRSLSVPPHYHRKQLKQEALLLKDQKLHINRMNTCSVRANNYFKIFSRVRNV